MQVAFEEEIIHSQYCIEKKRLGAYFLKYKLEIEVDEHDHKGRNPSYEQIRQLIIEGHGITVIRNNLEAPNSINRSINQIYMHIIESTEKQIQKSTKNLLINDLSKSLLELKFEKNHQIKSKCLKGIVKKIFLDYKE